MVLKRILRGLVGLALLVMWPRFSYAQIPGEMGKSAKGGGEVRLAVETGTMSVMHDQWSESERKGTLSRENNIEMAGTEADVSFKVRRWSAFAIARNLNPAEDLDWWQGRSELFVGIGQRMWFPQSLWGTMSFYRMTNSGSGSKDDSPATFLNGTNLMAFGLDLFESWGPAFLAGNKLTFRYRYNFLTSFQSDTNFGRDILYGLGWSFTVKQFTFGATYGVFSQFLKSERPDPKSVTKMQRSDTTDEGTRLSLHLEIRP
jgi:hypothetical protein